MREIPELSAELPRHTCALVHGNREPEVDIEGISLFPRMEYMAAPLRSSCLSRGRVHARRLYHHGYIGHTPPSWIGAQMSCVDASGMCVGSVQHFRPEAH